MLTFISYVIVAHIVVVAVAVAGKKYDFALPLSLMVVFSILANILANKIVSIGPFNVPAGIIIFSATFLLSNIISEFWGKKYTVAAIMGGFLANAVAAACVFATITLPSAPLPHALEVSNAFSVALAMTPRIVLASIISYIISQYVDVTGFFFLRRLTQGKHLWIRTTFSVLIAQLTSTLLFISMAFYGVLPLGKLLVSVFLMKVILLIIDVPFIYIARKLMMTLTGSAPIPADISLGTPAVSATR